nr:Rpn family recombination-promoting nuclease/putative transposase [Limosilactobacillus ingluviei]
MPNPNLCAELLRRALPELAIKWVKDADPQHTIQATPTAKGIRVDVYARDDQERTYTVEMQMVNEHNLPFRMREYQKLMDQEILNSSDDYDKLANYPTYVIFFCNLANDDQCPKGNRSSSRIVRRLGQYGACSAMVG